MHDASAGNEHTGQVLQTGIYIGAEVGSSQC